MLSKIAIVSALFSLAVASSSHARVPDEDSAVSENFKKIAREMRSMDRVGDAAEFSEMMGRFHAAAVANLDEVPSFAEKGSDLYADYIRGVEEFIATIESAKALAVAGDLVAAKAAADGLRDARSEWHDYFEFED